MNKFLLLFAAITTVLCVSAQDTTKTVSTRKAEMAAKRQAIDKKFAKYSRDHIVLDLLGTNWIYNPNDPKMDGMRTKWFSRGLNIYFNWDFRIKGSRVSFAPGIGYSCSNLYSRSTLNHTDSAGTYFTPIRVYGTDTTAKINKVVLQYVDIPLELRIRTDPDRFGNCWKVVIGIKGGVRVDEHTKFKIKQGLDTNVFVVRRDPDFSTWRVAPLIRVGYSFFNLTASYDLLPVFKNNLGPKGNAFSVGISFMAL